MSISQAKLKNILNVAFVGQGDFGDEAMAYVLRKFLKNYGFGSISYYQHGKFASHRSKHDLEISSLYGFASQRWQSYRWQRWKRRILNRFFLKQFEVLLIGGGSCLHSVNSIQWKFALAKRIKSRGGLAACLGVTLGPFKSSLNEEICAQLLDCVDMAIFRDKYSFNLAKKISGNQHLYSSLDTTFLLPELCSDEMLDRVSSKKEGDLVGVMFVKSKHREEAFTKSRSFEKYLTILNYILERNKKVILFTFYIGEDFLDQELNQLLKKHAKFPEKIEIHTYNGDIFQTVEQMNRCSFILSMRLHGIIFSYILGIPFLSLGYDPKNQNFCNSVNYPANMSFYFHSLENVEPVLGSLDSLFDRGSQLFNHCLPVKDATQRVKTNLNRLIEKLKKL